MAQRDRDWHGQWRCLSWPAGGPGASSLRAGWIEARWWVVDQMPGFSSCFLTDLKGRFLVLCMCVLSSVSVFATSCTVCSLAGSSARGTFQARILEGNALSSCRGIFPTQESNPCLLRLLHWQVDCLSPALRGKPELLVE